MRRAPSTCWISSPTLNRDGSLRFVFPRRRPAALVVPRVPNTDLNDASHWLCLTLVPGLSPLTLRALLSEFGSPEAVLGAAHAALRKFVPGEVAASIADGGNAAGAQAALAWLNEPDNHIVTLGDADYPQLLLQITDPPPLL